MAETKDGQKFIRVPEYTKEDGTVVRGHVRSTPRTSTGAQSSEERGKSRRRGDPR